MAVRIASLATLLLVLACEQPGRGVARGQAAADTSAVVWLARSLAQPEIASWLYLRAAAQTRDSMARSALYARVTLPLARERIPWVEAAALETFGDTAAALTAYTKLPAPITILRLRAAVRPAARDSVRRDLIAFIASASSSGPVREATGLFDTLFNNAAPDEQLIIARATARVGYWSRARDGFAAVPQANLTSSDLFSYGTALSRLNADRQAEQVYAKVTKPASLALAAQYQRARAVLAAGDPATARTQLLALSRSGSDTSAAAALSLLADLQTDDGDDTGSRATLLGLVRRFPSTRFATPARFDAALIAFILGDSKSAAREFRALVSMAPSVAPAASYWLGRSMSASGDSSGARTAWTAVLRDDSTSYYASLAANRLGVESMHSSSVSGTYPHVPQVDSAMRRVSLLQQFGMSAEAQMENVRLYREAASDNTRLLATASAFSGTDQAARAIALGRTALTRIGSTPDVWRLIFPVASRDTIVTESRKAGLDPALVAALIRQESNFNPGARSAAGARGLMQVMPAVGKAIAPAAGIISWDPNLLYNPGINVEIGIRHLAPLVRSQSNIPRTLAAYNAGESRVKRWSTKKGADDPEIFTERIPFTETRDYVKSVLRNREFYRVLYAW